MFNYNYAQAKAITSNYKEAEEVGRGEISLTKSHGTKYHWRSHRAKCHWQGVKGQNVTDRESPGKISLTGSTEENSRRRRSQWAKYQTVSHNVECHLMNKYTKYDCKKNHQPTNIFTKHYSGNFSIISLKKYNRDFLPQCIKWINTYYYVQNATGMMS